MAFRQPECGYRCVKGSLKNHLQEKNYAKGDCTKKTCLYIGAIP